MDFSEAAEFEQVKELLSKQLKIELSTIEDDANILDDLGADSLELLLGLLELCDLVLQLGAHSVHVLTLASLSMSSMILMHSK